MAISSTPGSMQALTIECVGSTQPHRVHQPTHFTIATQPGITVMDLDSLEQHVCCSNNLLQAAILLAISRYTMPVHIQQLCIGWCNPAPPVALNTIAIWYEPRQELVTWMITLHLVGHTHTWYCFIQTAWQTGTKVNMRGEQAYQFVIFIHTQLPHKSIKSRIINGVQKLHFFPPLFWGVWGGGSILPFLMTFMGVNLKYSMQPWVPGHLCATWLHPGEGQTAVTALGYTVHTPNNVAEEPTPSPRARCLGYAFVITTVVSFPD